MSVIADATGKQCRANGPDKFTSCSHERKLTKIWQLLSTVVAVSRRLARVYSLQFTVFSFWCKS
jgi:hypothetical protein